ncbi:MAG: hypothetical protein QW356_06015 [Candidatus Hadarchaeales archaeon]
MRPTVLLLALLWLLSLPPLLFPRFRGPGWPVVFPLLTALTVCMCAQVLLSRRAGGDGR